MADKKALDLSPIGSPEGPPAPAACADLSALTGREAREAVHAKLRALVVAADDQYVSLNRVDVVDAAEAAGALIQRLGEVVVALEAGALQPRAPAEEWQPIATAPKDGRLTLLYPGRHWSDDVNCDCEVGYWDSDYAGGVWWADATHTKGADDYTGPTHWMVLPAPPGAALREATPAMEKEGYGNARCICGHLSSHHNCDHATSDTSCFDCGCEAFATIQKSKGAVAPPLSREALGELKSSVMTQDSDDQLVRRVEGRLFARLADLISAPQTPRPVLHGDGWFTGEGGIVIEAHCKTCQQPYPTYSASSQMRCPDCRQRYERALAALLPPQEPTP